MRIHLPLALILTAASLTAGPPREMTYSSYEQWAAGVCTGVEVWSPGALSRAGRVDSIAVGEEQYVWDLCPTRQGGVLLSTGGGGRVFHYDGSKLRQVFDSPENDLLCIVEGGDGSIWTGSSPDGIVYRLGPGASPVEEFTTHQGAVWCLAPFRGGVLAGTGPEGRLFHCVPGKTPKELAQTSMANVLSVLPMPDGSVLVTGDTPCVLQRLDPDSVLFTVARFDDDEGRCLTHLGPDSIGLVVMTAPVQGRSSSLLLTGPAAGPFRQLWESPDSLAIDLIPKTEGLIVVGGWPGRAHRVTDGTTFRRIVQVRSEQILCGAPSDGRLYLGAGSPAWLYWLEDRRVSSATWRSPPIDAGTVAQWGRVTWMGAGGGLSLRAHTGNLGNPEDGWSAWSPGKETDHGWEISVPEGRFAQLEITLADGDGTQAPLEWLQIRFQPYNRDPVITSFELLPPGQKPPGAMGRVGAPAQRPSDRWDQRSESDSDRYLSWNSADEDGDELQYAASFREYPSGEWVSLINEGDEAFAVIPHGTVPEGWYVFRLTATDEPDNPPSRAGKATATIGPLLLDDTPPILRDATWERRHGQRVVTLEVRDDGSGVARVSVAGDGLAWTVVEPVDGIVDSGIERFTIEMADAARRLSVRLMDRVGNSTTVSVSPPR